MTSYSNSNVCSRTHRLAIIHFVQTTDGDRQTDRQTQHCSINATVLSTFGWNRSVLCLLCRGFSNQLRCQYNAVRSACSQDAATLHVEYSRTQSKRFHSALFKCILGQFCIWHEWLGFFIRHIIHAYNVFHLNQMLLFLLLPLLILSICLSPQVSSILFSKNLLSPHFSRNLL